MPQSQQDLPADDPAKIRFRSYEIEEKEYRSPIFCGNGLVLIPTDVVHRLQNEDQLAAVLADGIAGTLQLQAELGRGFTWRDVAMAAALGALGEAGMVGASAALAHNLGVIHNAEHPNVHQRGRLSLALMADAGFNPHQAPEAWRLLAPSRPPKDPARLKYPERSQYLQSVLDTQYNTGTRNADQKMNPASPDHAPVTQTPTPASHQ